MLRNLPSSFQIKSRSIPILFFFFVFVIGISSAPVFGLSVDENLQRQHRLVQLKYTLEKFGLAEFTPQSATKLPSLDSYPHWYYGVGIQIPLLLLEYHPTIDHTNREFWIASHYYSHSVFLVSAIAFYLLVRNIGLSQWLAVFVTSLYIFNPRIYAHSFYNIKDLMFLSLVTISLYLFHKYLTNNRLSTLLMLAVILSFTLNSRLMGVALIPIFLGGIILNNKVNFKEIITQTMLFILVSFACLVLIWPSLWNAPVHNLIAAFQAFTRYDSWLGNVIFNGEFVSATNLPPGYIPQWIMITVPLGVLLLWILSLLVAPFLMVKTNLNIHTKYYFFSILILLLGSFLFVIYKKSILYDDWRHLYYFHTFFCILTAYLYLLIGKLNKLFAYALIATVILLSIPTIFWMLTNNPHYYVYFNKFGGKNWNERWERDVWKLSTKQALELIALDQSTHQKTVFDPDLKSNSIWLLSKSQQQSINMVNDLESADFIIGDYRNVIGDYPPDFFPGFTNYLELKIDNNPIVTIFKRDI